MTMILTVLGYIGFGLLIFWAATWMIGVRTRLGVEPTVIFGSLLYTASVMLLPALGVSLLHSWWIIPAVMIFAYASAHVFVHQTPLLFPLLWFVTSIYADVIRLGISKERITDARRAAVRELLASLAHEQDGEKDQVSDSTKSAA